MISNTTSSNGGPIIALPAEIAHLWRGTLPPVGVEVPKDWEWGGDDGIICDYDRVCDELNDEFPFGYALFGWLPVGNSKALAFSIEQPITFIPEKTGGIIANDEDGIDELIKSISPGLWKLYPQTLNLEDGRLFIFDSAFEAYKDPEDIYADNDVVVAQLSPGTYKIFHYNNEDEVGFVRLEKQ
ncbi:MAG: Imm21 family immunity protein [Daejeonella sp.]